MVLAGVGTLLTGGCLGVLDDGEPDEGPQGPTVDESFCAETDDVVGELADHYGTGTTNHIEVFESIGHDSDENHDDEPSGQMRRDNFDAALDLLGELRGQIDHAIVGYEAARDIAETCEFSDGDVALVGEQTSTGIEASENIDAALAALEDACETYREEEASYGELTEAEEYEEAADSLLFRAEGEDPLPPDQLLSEMDASNSS